MVLKRPPPNRPGSGAARGSKQARVGATLPGLLGCQAELWEVAGPCIPECFPRCPAQTSLGRGGRSDPRGSSGGPDQETRGVFCYLRNASRLPGVARGQWSRKERAWRRLAGHHASTPLADRAVLCPQQPQCGQTQFLGAFGLLSQNVGSWPEVAPSSPYPSRGGTVPKRRGQHDSAPTDRCQVGIWP